MQGSGVARPFLALAAWLMLSTCAITSSFAAGPNKAAQGLAKQAKQAYDKGDLEKASSIYYDAWVADPSQIGLLFSAAVAAKSAGKLDHAREWFEKFLTQKESSSDPSRVDRAKAALQEISKTQGDLQRKEADKASADGDFPLAAGKYMAAHKLDPERQIQCLYLAGQAFEKAKDLESAKAAYEKFLATAPADAAERPAAKAGLQRIADGAQPQSPGVAGSTETEAQRKAKAEAEIQRRVQEEMLARRAAEEAAAKARTDAEAAKPKWAKWDGFYTTFRVGYYRTLTDPVAGTPGAMWDQDVSTQGKCVADGQANDPNAEFGMQQGYPCPTFTIHAERATGAAVALQFGYNVLGYASIGAEVAAMGLRDTSDPAATGAGFATVLLGVHPLRFVAEALPVDVVLYGGFKPVHYWWDRASIRTNTDGQGDWYQMRGSVIGIEFGGHPKPGDSLVLGLDLRYEMDTLVRRIRSNVTGVGTDPSVIAPSSGRTVSTNEISREVSAILLMFVIGSR